MGLKEVGCEDADWINPTPDSDPVFALMKTATNLHFPIKVWGNS
jgi:hypothetical protein